MKNTAPVTDGIRKSTTGSGQLRVWMADDDYNDHLFMLMAAEEARLDADFRFLDDGAQLMLALTSINDPADLPDIIVLDIRMPRLDGHGTLKQLQDHPDLWQIPVIVYTSSTRPVDQTTSFDRGARWFETKPSKFPDMVAFARRIGQYAATSSATHATSAPPRHQSGKTFDPTSLRFDPKLFEDIEAALRFDD